MIPELNTEMICWLLVHREEKEAIQREAEEKEKLRTMTDIERAAWDRANPKVVGDVSIGVGGLGCPGF